MAEGLVERQLNSADRRSVVAVATEKGRLVFGEARSRRLGLLATRLAGLTDADLELLREAAALMERCSGANADSGGAG